METTDPRPFCAAPREGGAHTVIGVEAMLGAGPLASDASVFKGVEVPNVSLAAVCANIRDPAKAPITLYLLANADMARGISRGYAQIPHIRHSVAQSQIVDAVVRAVAIDVVDLSDGPATVIQRPDDVMRLDATAKQPPLTVSHCVEAKGLPPSIARVPAADFPHVPMGTWDFKRIPSLKPKKAPALVIITEQDAHNLDWNVAV
jgi:hypothetical protein